MRESILLISLGHLRFQKRGGLPAAPEELVPRDRSAEKVDKSTADEDRPNRENKHD